jgi:hypothetical protein
MQLQDLSHDVNKQSKINKFKTTHVQLKHKNFHMGLYYECQLPSPILVRINPIHHIFVHEWFEYKIKFENSVNEIHKIWIVY